MDHDTKMPDAEAAAEEEEQYGHLQQVEDLNAKYPNRPHNHSKTLPFHELYLNLFDPLTNISKKKGPAVSGRKQGSSTTLPPHEMRHRIISRFIDRWRSLVGDDFYPALRLILPDKDRDRAMYGLKEKTIGKLLVRVMGINKSSEDAESLVNWKLPGKYASATGDFAARCYAVVQKRPILTRPGNLTIGQVNVMLDQLSVVSKEDEQLPIFTKFYNQMNPEEFQWLIRIILRQMKVGATEKTILNIWHPNAESLFNVSSSLKRVCWELYDPKLRLEDSDLKIMDCFQPQLAAFQMHSFDKIVARMEMTPDDQEFWIEEKLDGERMQLHAQENPAVPGGMEFKFWSRKAKDYTYLYGANLEDKNTALTKYLKGAFNPGVRSIVLDGEMVTWNMLTDKIDVFGNLKTYALEEQTHTQTQSDKRPLYRVFDCLFLNGKALTRYTLRDRREALQKSVREIRRRLETHPYEKSVDTKDIENALRKAIDDGAEGLVVKNPRSRYRVGDRNEDWIKVKPEYMAEFGEEFDCVIIGGYYGSGHRGGIKSSYLCGVPFGDKENPQKCFTFCKVGGGYTSDDYRKIQSLTEGKWHKFDAKKPPTDWIIQGPSVRPDDRPHEWIKPEDSVVISIKAGQILHNVPNYGTNCTLRFPRLRELRTDKSWTEALTLQSLQELIKGVKKKEEEKQFQLDDERRQKRRTIKTRRPLILAGAESVNFRQDGQTSSLFTGLTFFVLSGSTMPEKKSKAELEAMIKSNGGAIVQSYSGTGQIICISETRTLKASSIQKASKLNIVKPLWLFDCIYQSRIDDGRPSLLLPFEPNHMFHTIDDDREMIAANTDEYGDSYCRDVSIESLRKICNSMKDLDRPFDKQSFIDQLEDSGVDFSDIPGNAFQRLSIYFDRPESDLDMEFAVELVKFGGGTIASSFEKNSTTHVVVGKDRSRLSEIRTTISQQSPIPRIVDVNWVLESWREKTVLGEERFPPS